MAHEVMVVLELTQERDPIQSSTTHVDIDLHLGRTRVERKLDRWKDVFKAYSSTAAGAGEWWVESLAGCRIGVISSGVRDLMSAKMVSLQQNFTEAAVKCRVFRLWL